MNVVTLIMLAFSILGALDRIIGNRFGLGKEFEKGFLIFGNIALSMIGMIVLSPWIVDVLSPFFDGFYEIFHIDPSIIPATLFANDMGGATLANDVAKDADLGLFNGLVVSTMMGCTISYTLPCAMNLVESKHYKEVFLGFLCGILTIPVGCLVSGIVCSIPFGVLLYNLLPLFAFAILIAGGLFFCPNICVEIFKCLAMFIQILITIGLAIGIIQFLTGVEMIKGLSTLEEGGMICLNACAVLTGTFPLIYVISKILGKPLMAISSRVGINEIAAVGFVSSLATSTTTFEAMNKMDKKGIVLNSAFAISGAFVFAGHLAFTLAFDSDYVFPMIVGKLVAGVLAIFVANIIYKRGYEQNEKDRL